MSSNATLGTTIRRPRRMVGNSPRAASLYANARETPSRRPASATDTTNWSPDNRVDALVIATRASLASAADVEAASRDCCSDRIWWIEGGFMSTTMNDERNENLHENLHGARKSKKSAVNAKAPLLAPRFPKPCKRDVPACVVDKEMEL
jgi:hypothetical protein